MSFDRWLFKETVVYLYHEIKESNELLIHMKTWLISWELCCVKEKSQSYKVTCCMFQFLKWQHLGEEDRAAVQSVKEGVER